MEIIDPQPENKNISRFRVIIREEAQPRKSKSFGVYDAEVDLDQLFILIKEYLVALR